MTSDFEIRRRRWALRCWQPLTRKDWFAIFRLVVAALVCAAVWRAVWVVMFEKF
jgi:hypothetical protein